MHLIVRTSYYYRTLPKSLIVDKNGVKVNHLFKKGHTYQFSYSINAKAHQFLSVTTRLISSLVDISMPLDLSKMVYGRNRQAFHHCHCFASLLLVLKSIPTSSSFNSVACQVKRLANISLFLSSSSTSTAIIPLLSL